MDHLHVAPHEPGMRVRLGDSQRIDHANDESAPPNASVSQSVSKPVGKQASRSVSQSVGESVSQPTGLSVSAYASKYSM